MSFARSSNYIQIILTFYSLHNMVQKLTQMFYFSNVPFIFQNIKIEKIHTDSQKSMNSLEKID